jgi:riboflavin synthase
MFTGIIENVATVVNITKKGSNRILTLESKLAPLLKIDQSLSHNGACLTVIACNKKSYSVVAIKETLHRTNLGQLKIGDPVNLERSITLQTRLDGHLVQGHVDACSKILNVTPLKGSWTLELGLEKEFRKWVIEKGSICLNGISLTVSKLNKKSMEVSIIPYTYEHTNFKKALIGDLINVEFDLIGKYIEHQVRK